jgi:hypothetical protein
MRRNLPSLKRQIPLALALWSILGPAIHARVEPTGTAKPAVAESDEEEERENPEARQKFRLLTLTSGNRQYDPNDLVKAKAHVKTMRVSPSAWPKSQAAAAQEQAAAPQGQVSSQGAVAALTAGIQPSDWTPLGPGNIGGRTRSLVIHPTNPSIMYLGSVGGGIWKTVNGGTNWTILNDFMPSLAIGALIMDPKNANILYAGTGESYPGDGLRGAGVFKTTDGGVTWNQLASTANANWYYTNRLAISPVNSQILLAATQTGIYRSTDGGASWNLVLNDISTDLEWHPTDGNLVVASGNNNASYWSNNAGVTWTASTGMPAFGRVELAVAKSSPSTIYASVYQNGGEVYRSTDGGHTFTLRNTGSQLLSGQGWYDNAIWVDPLNPSNLLIGGVGMNMSTDAGATWQSVWVGDLHADQHYIIEAGGYSASNRAVYVTNDGGIFRTDNFLNVANGSFWYSVNHDLGVTQFYAGAGNPNNGMVAGGTQDNGTPRYNGTYNGWLDVIGSDGGWTASDPNLAADGSSYWYGETQYWNTIRVHLDASGNPLDNTSFSGTSDNGYFIPPMILDPNNPQRLYKGGSQLWRLDNARTAAWDAPWTIVRPSGETISAIAVAPGNSNVIWVGHYGSVWSTSNGLAATPTWNQRGAGVLPSEYCTRVTIDPTNVNRIYVTYGGFNHNNVWKSEDGGNTWTSIVNNLPAVPCRTLVVNKWNSNRIYVGTEIGVFASEDRGATWSPSNDGPANASVDELFWVGNKLTAATHGRGMFRITVNTPPTAAITVPANNANFPAGSNIAITATASDPDGSIAKVEFFQGSTKIGEDASSPYQATFANAPAGSYALTARATDNDGGTFTSAVVNITVGTSSGIALPGRLQAEDYKTGGEGVGYHDLSAGNTGNQYRTDNVDIEATTDAGGGFNVGWIDAGEWLEYNVNVSATANYTLTARMASGNAGTKTATVTVDGVAKGTFSFTDASGWQSWKDVTVAGVNLTAGAHVLRITMTTGGFNLNYLDVIGAANQAPISNAGVDRTVNTGTLVTLDGRASSDPDNGPSPLTYSWAQIGGTAVTLGGANTSQPSFTPSTAGIYTFRLTVSDGAATAFDDIVVTANTGTVYINLPGRLQAEDYKTGGEGVGYHDLTAGNTGNQYRTDNVDIEATTDAGGGYNVGWIQTGEWLEYNINVTATGTYSFTARMASGSAGTKTASVTVDGAAKGTFNLTNVTGWQSWYDVTVAGLSLTAGTHVLRVTMTVGDFNLNYLDVSATANQVPVANAGTDKTVNTNTLVTLDGRASSDPDNGPSPLSYAWSQVSGPTVTLSGATTSQPTFTPASTGTYVFRLTVNDGAATATDDVQVTVNTGTVFINLPGRIQAEDYKAGGEGVGYHDLSAGNTGNQYRTDNVDIEATTDAGGGYNVGWTQAGEWLAFDVNVATAGTYTLTARMSSGAAGTKSMAWSVDGGAVSTFSFTDASGWQSWKDVVLTGISLTAGTHVVRLTMNTADFNVNYVDVAAAPVNLLQNGDFSNGITGWNTYFAAPATGTIANESGSARITITNAGVNEYDIQLWQASPLTAGKAYTLDFDVKAEATPKNFKIVVEHNGTPWTKYVEQAKTITAAANTYQHYTVTWTQGVDDAGARVVFDFGAQNVNDLWVDNVVLK